MASYLRGNLISLDPNDSFILNKPIANIRALSAANFKLDDQDFSIPGNYVLSFPSIYGYPGYNLTSKNPTARIFFIIQEFGDVLNRDYFTDWRTE